MLLNLRSFSIVSILACAIVYIIGMFVNVMDVDAAQYASISREMLEKWDFIHVTNRYKDYLDKPPLLFWLSSLSMYVFGVNNFAYKLPSILITILGIYSTYRFSLLYYKKEVAYLSAVILASTQALFLITNDLRTDTNLLGTFIFSIWHIAAYLKHKKLINLVWGSVGIGLAMLAKGPIGIVAPIMAFGAHLLARRNLTPAFSPILWVVSLGIIFIVLLPMNVGLYQQFDLHPEKVVNGETGVSGLRFYYWTQSFGRITGESVWDNGAGPFFLTHSMMWAFLPWALFFVIGFFTQMAKFIKNGLKINEDEEVISLLGFLLPFMALSMSRYQLPHYGFVVFPLAAVITAKLINEWFFEGNMPKFGKIISWVQYGLLNLLWIIVGLLIFISFPDKSYIFAGILILGFVFFQWIYFSYSNWNKVIVVSVITAVGINLLVNAYLYPQLLKYQTPSEVGKIVHEKGIAKDKFYSYKCGDPQSIDFYAQRVVPIIKELDPILGEKGIWLYTKKEEVEKIKKKFPTCTIVYEHPFFHVTKLSLPFLNPNTRNKVTTVNCLVKLD